MRNLLVSLSVFAFCAAALQMSACATGGETRELSNHEKALMHVDLAYASLRSDDTASAFSELKVAEALEPDLPRLHLARAMVFYARQDLDSALLSVEKAHELDSKDSAINTAYGKILYDLKRIGEAEQVLKVAAKDYLYPESFKPKTSLGIIYYDQKIYPKANEYFSAAIQDNPTGACLAYYYRGKIKALKSDFNGAIVDYKKSAQGFCGANTDSHLEIAETYIKTKQYDLARKKFVEIINLFPDTKVAEIATQKLRYIP